MKISAFFPGLVRINRKLNIVTSQLSILRRRDKIVFLGELAHKPISVSKTKYNIFPQSSHCIRHERMGATIQIQMNVFKSITFRMYIYFNSEEKHCQLLSGCEVSTQSLTGGCLYLLISSNDPQTMDGFITYSSFRCTLVLRSPILEKYT